MRRSLWVTGGVILVLVLAGMLGVAAAEPFAPQQEEVDDFDFVEYRLLVDPDGSVVWTFQFTVSLANDSEVEEFEDFAETFRNEETTLYANFVSQAEGLAESGSDATGREMAASSFERNARLEQDALGSSLGVVEMSFRWSNFAVVDGDRVEVGDVFTGGLFLDANQRLVIVAGEGLQFADRSPSPESMDGDSIEESGRLTWDGERLFSDGEPRVVLTADGGDGNAVIDPGDDSAGGDDPGIGDEDPADDEGSLWPIVIGGLAILGAIGVIGFWLYSGGRGGLTRETPGTPVAVSETDLLDDEERVVQLLESNGGRMKQVSIVDETGWSKSKVSMLLSDMEEEEIISKLRVGRENIVSLKGHEPAATRSALDPDRD